MLKKTKGPVKKRVHWDEAVEDNEGITRAKRQKTEHLKREKKSFSPQLIEGIKATIKEYFNNGSFDQLEEILNKYSLSKRIKILSVGNYELFRSAALANNIKALNFIANSVPQNIILDMVSYREFTAFTFFLIHTQTLEKLGKLDHQNRIEGFKIFLKVAPEDIQRVFNEFDNKLSKADPIQDSIRKDFTIALTQLQEEGIIPVEESSIVEESLSNDELEPSKNALLKHLGDNINIDLNKTNLTFHSTANHAVCNSETIEKSSSKDISNLTETAKKAEVSPNVSNTSVLPDMRIEQSFFEHRSQGV
jgi:hypothetical protein